MGQREDLNKVSDIVANLYDFTDGGVRGRRVLMEQANLSRFLAGIDLAGTPRVVAGDIVQRLSDFGFLPEKQTYHALGALLSYLLGLPDLAPDDARFLATTVVRYSLVTDLTYTARLREQYGITDTVAELSKGYHFSPAPSPEIDSDNEPTFEAHLTDTQELEAVLNSEDNFLDVNMLGGAIYSAQAVCRVEIPEGTAVGTGFLIGPDLLLTNQHVLKNADYLDAAVCRFNYVIEPSTNVAPPGRIVQFRPDFYHASVMSELDYAVGRLAEAPLADMAAKSGGNGLSPWQRVLAGEHKGYLPLVPRKIVERERLNIIQHPGGNPMKVVLTQNYVVYADQSRVQYVADTMGGSSGSPVFNQNWEVVALHHSGGPYPPSSLGENLNRAWKGRFRVNEGIPMRAILGDFKRSGIERYLPRT